MWQQMSAPSYSHCRVQLCEQKTSSQNVEELSIVPSSSPSAHYWCFPLTHRPVRSMIRDQSDPWSQTSQIKLVHQRSHFKSLVVLGWILDLICPCRGNARSHKQHSELNFDVLTATCWPLTRKHCRLKQCTEIFGFYKLCVSGLVKLGSIIVTSWGIKLSRCPFL